MIEVEHLTKSYGAVPVLRDISFNVEPGEILGFLGPNGAGKTTTMRVITGYLPATTGTVRVAGFDVAEKSLEARQHLGYLPETVPLYTELTPFEYLDFRGRINGLHNGRDRRARIYEVFDELNLGGVGDKLIGTLSRGYRQRVGLAQALLHNPDALILDEPTVGLDPVQITEVRNLIKELGRNHTIILSTHLLPEVSMVCNRVVIINRGRLVAVDTPIHLAQSETGTPTVQLEVAGPSDGVLSALRVVPGVVDVKLLPQQESGQETVGAPGATNLYQVDGRPGSDLRSQLAAAVTGSNFRLLELRGIRPTLEDVFIRVITQEEEAEALGEHDDNLAGADQTAEEPWDDNLDGAGDGAVRLPTATRTKVVAKRRVRR